MSSQQTSDYERNRNKWSRGQTPDDIIEICRRLCGQYLGGIWSEINDGRRRRPHLTVRRITGGFTNQMYYCAIDNNSDNKSCRRQLANDTPTEVVVRLYGKKWIESSGSCVGGGGSDGHNERLNDIVIYLMASKRGLGPKQLAFFADGSIEQFIKLHTFGLSEQSQDRYVCQLAGLLAQFHAMPVPIARTGDWFRQFVDSQLTKANRLFPLADMFVRLDTKNLMTVDLKKECQWLHRCLAAVNSPVVFAHNDFRGANVLVHELADDDGGGGCDTDGQQSVVDRQLLTLCDFEYSCYGYRGFDFGAIFEDWGRTETNNIGGNVSDETLRKFMTSYLDESVRIGGMAYREDSMVNTVDHLVREAKVFLMAQQMFFIMFCLATEEMPYNKTKDQILQRGDQRLGYYLELKNKYLSEGLIK
ncbi:choline/ethanolamine kinase-like [Oppia nitens]|uniref:choline/ethanolamine kinase-like n=1 Tax=Oppia nitens TaxID=1686743 RepID=UPI0023DC704D|nr:choline/ethanolamine kinase-like [Oppia nitens]